MQETDGTTIIEPGKRSPDVIIEVGMPEFESGTSSLSATRSNQLSYTPFAQADTMAPVPVRSLEMYVGCAASQLWRLLGFQWVAAFTGAIAT